MRVGSSTVQAISSMPAASATVARRAADDRVVDPHRLNPHLGQRAGRDAGQAAAHRRSAASIGALAQRFDVQSLVTFG